MKFILSTYNFYPQRGGGTEVYTSLFAEYLMASGHEVLIIAAFDQPVPDLGKVIRASSLMYAREYMYNGLRVLGVVLSGQDPLAVYTNYREEWVDEFVKALEAAGFSDPDQLVLNGMTTVSGPALMEAAKKLSTDCKIQVITHTPFHCPKGDMLDSFTGTRCEQLIGPKTCSRCMYKQKGNTGRSFSIFLEWVGNRILGKIFTRKAFNTRSLIRQRIERFRSVDELTEQVIVFSEDMKRFLQKQEFITGSKLHVVRHGIDKRVFYQGKEKDPETRIFLYAGRFETVKGILTLAKAWVSLPPKHGRFLYLSGNWSSSSVGAETRGILNGRSDVKWFNNLSQAELAEVYREAHCLIIPSTWVETGPMVFHEAVACGCNIISTDIGGQGELAGFYHELSDTFTANNIAMLSHCIDSFQYKPVGSEVLGRIKDHQDHFRNIFSQFTKI